MSEKKIKVKIKFVKLATLLSFLTAVTLTNAALVASGVPHELLVMLVGGHQVVMGMHLVQLVQRLQRRRMLQVGDREALRHGVLLRGDDRSAVVVGHVAIVVVLLRLGRLYKVRDASPQSAVVGII